MTPASWRSKSSATNDLRARARRRARPSSCWVSGMAERSDRELVEAFCRGDGAAFDALVARYVRLAGGVAYGIVGDYEAAADVVQEAFLKVHGAIRELREPERFKGWLYGIVRSSALDALRRDRRKRASS